MLGGGSANYNLAQPVTDAQKLSMLAQQHFPQRRVGDAEIAFGIGCWLG